MIAKLGEEVVESLGKIVQSFARENEVLRSGERRARGVTTQPESPLGERMSISDEADARS
jgi:hypothetical protein